MPSIEAVDEEIAQISEDLKAIKFKTPLPSNKNKAVQEVLDKNKLEQEKICSAN